MPITTTLKKTSAFAAAALLAACCLAPNSALAAVDTYNVDLSGIDSGSGNELRVFGTITLDADLDVGSAITASSLQFQRDSESPIVLPSIPLYNGLTGSGTDWVVDGQDLYLTRITTGQEFIQWGASTGLGRSEFTLGSGANPHTIEFLETIPFVQVDMVILKSASGPDGPLGFKVGTAVPEPTSAAMLAVSLGALTLRRRRRSA